MNHAVNPAAHRPAASSLARRAWPIALLGCVAVLSLLVQPVPAALLASAPELAALPPLALRAVLLVNPCVLVLVAAVVGAALAHRSGLRSMLAGTASSAGWAATAAQAAAGGFALGLALAAADAAAAPFMGPAWQALVDTAPRGAAATAMGMLYGGVAEEVMLRWGAMSLVAWALARLLRSRGRGMAMSLAIAVSAGLFAAGHLPALAAQLDLTFAVVTRTLLLNTVAGLLYGWLFWRHHLEAAMAAHAATHLGLAAWRLLAA